MTKNFDFWAMEEIAKDFSNIAEFHKSASDCDCNCLNCECWDCNCGNNCDCGNCDWG